MGVCGAHLNSTRYWPSLILSTHSSVTSLFQSTMLVAVEVSDICFFIQDQVGVKVKTVAILLVP